MDQQKFKIIQIDNSLKPLPKSISTINQELQLMKSLEKGKILKKSWETQESFWKSDLNVKNQFLSAIHMSYQYHLPLLLSPDQIWLVILQGVAIYVNLNSENLRQKFVDFEGKRNLIIEVLADHISQIDWGSAINEFSKLIEQNTNQEVSKLCIPTFSTTDSLMKLVYGITLMDIVQAYFEYTIVLGCGIPEVKLCGELEDWKKLLNMISQLDDLNLNWWTKHLLPIVSKIVKAYEGEVDKTFWNDIYHYRQGKASGQAATASGWITVFFPYQKIHGKIELRKNLSLKSDIFPNSLPDSLSSAPVLLYNLVTGETTNVRFYSGFVGVIKDSEGYITPKTGWVIQETQEIKKEQPKSKSIFSPIK